MTDTDASTAKYIFTLVQERHYDSDLGPEEELGSVILDVDPAHLDAPERQILDLLRASGMLDNEQATDEENTLDPDDPDNDRVTYYIKATPAVEVDSIEEAAESLIHRNRWLTQIFTTPADATAAAEPTPEPEGLDLSYDGMWFRTGDHLHAETPAFTPGKVNRFEFTLTPESFAGFKPEELDMDQTSGIPLLDGYVRPQRLKILQPDESHINLDSFVPQALQDVSPGDMVVFDAPQLGVLMAAVEAGKHTTWNPNRGWLSVDISDGFILNLVPPNQFAPVRYLGVL